VGCTHQGILDTCDISTPSEELGWVAIDVLNENFTSLTNFQFGKAAVSNSIWEPQNFSSTYANVNAITTQNSDSGAQDPQYAWIRSLTNSSLEVRYCEQDGANYCDSHNAEDMVWLALESGDLIVNVEELDWNQIGSHSENNSFIWNITGYDHSFNYSLRCRADDIGSVGYTNYYNSVDLLTMTNLSVEIIDVIDSNGQKVDVNITILDDGFEIINLSVVPTNHALEKIIIYNYNKSTQSLNTLRIENSTNDLFFNKTFSLDPEGLDAEYLNITFTSTGKHLYKCIDFNFTTQSCSDDDNYTQIRTDLVPGQKYTITIDPFDPGFGITVEGSENVIDTRLRSGKPDDNYGGLTRLRVGRRNSGNLFRSLVWFNISQIQQNLTIQNAELSLYLDIIPGSDSNNTRTHGVHRINESRSWDELDSTWNNYTSNQAWSNGGGDFVSTATDTALVNSTLLGTRISYNVTSDVVNFANNSFENNGWLIKELSETLNNYRMDYASTENSNVAKHPQLIINYTTPSYEYINVTQQRPIIPPPIQTYGQGEEFIIGADVRSNNPIGEVYANISVPFVGWELIELFENGYFLDCLFVLE